MSSAIQDQRSNTPDSMISSPAMSASTPSAFSIQSPILAGAGVPGRPNLSRNGNSLASGVSSVRFSPQPPPPIVVRGAEDFFVGEAFLGPPQRDICTEWLTVFQMSKATRLVHLQTATATELHLELEPSWLDRPISYILATVVSPRPCRTSLFTISPSAVVCKLFLLVECICACFVGSHNLAMYT